jgi:tRNA pseudouridine55 synthase
MVIDGLLIIDKPSGPTSHDVVARMRRVLREKAIGHTGTLDPMATGVLLLVIGKATRLAKFLSTSHKSYEASIRFGFSTDTADAHGRPIGVASDRPMPSREDIAAALEAFRGTFMQQPPAFSAKKIDGQRSYTLARSARGARADVAPRTEHPAPRTSHPAPLDLSDPPGLPGLPAVPAPCRVTTTRLEIVNIEADCVTLSLDCSAGFYVRSLAHDLGERLGVGAHLSMLRRTRVGDFGVDRAVTLDAAERDPRAIAAALVPMTKALPGLPAVVLTSEGAGRVSHGHDVRPHDRIAASPKSLPPTPFVRLLTVSGDLLAIAEPVAGGALHPSVVLV